VLYPTRPGKIAAGQGLYRPVLGPVPVPVLVLGLVPGLVLVPVLDH
tara:strand:- start:252 stop:389 length:138 start_codon:yes stop_codon:yes gene_type:complete